MNARKVFGIGLVLALRVVALYAHGVVDQQQTTVETPCLGLQDVFSGIAYQSFQPAAGTFVAIDMMYDVASPVDITLKLLDGECPSLGAMLGSSTVAVPAGAGQIVHFDFDPTLEIVPGQSYSIRVTATDPTEVAICGANADPYPAGSAFDEFCSSALPADGYFVTYAAGPGPPAPPDSMAGYWPFEEGSGSQTADRSGHSVAGTISGATWVVDPMRGHVLSFDGDGDEVHVPAFVAELGKGSFTIAAWVKISAGHAGGLFLKGDDDGTWEAGEKQLWFGDGGTCCNTDGERPSFVGYANDYIIPSADLGTADWHHVAFTWDYLGGTSGVPRVYIDAVEQKLDLADYAANQADRSSDTLYIGAGGAEESAHDFLGLVDDVAFFDAVLDGDQIATIMAGDFSQFTDLFVDGFESADTSAWSGTTP